MDSKQTWIIAGILVLVVGACLCGLTILILGGTGWAISQFAFIAPTDTAFPTSTRAATPLPAAATEVIPSIPITETPASTEATSFDPKIRAQMDEIEVQVMELRGLRSTGPVPRTLLTTEELRQRVLDDFLADYSEEEARDDVRVLALLGLIDPNFDLLTFYFDLYTEQIAGFYDDELKEMYVVQGEGFKGPERLTYAHEFVHALQDQTYDLQDGLGFNDEACEEDSERCAGVQALIEGDATFLEGQWLRNYATPQDYLEIAEFIGTFEMPVYDSAPAFMKEDFIFPYSYGLAFVQEIHFNGGWASVDAAYANPPISTEQILHPERYPNDRPIMLEPLDLALLLGEGWREIEHDVLGEWYTRLTLDEFIDEDLSEIAAAGWDGDTYVALYHDAQEQGAFVLLTLWDSARDAEEFYLAFEEYGETRFGNGSLSTLSATWDSNEGHVRIERWGNQTLWILTPDAEELEILRGAIEFPLPNP
ncbi:MAG: hypothetical protein A2Z14_04530 [Chloroflexi bacterium RBG_16_48_8]|nr:MAG: hypothetical protein A2Z14_04530 [Chloroflexi bacterium RBG_16_48_8]